MKKRIKGSSIVRISQIAIVLIALLLVLGLPASISITGEGALSIEANVALAVNNPPTNEATNQSYAIGDEVVEKRTRNSKTTYLGGANYSWDGTIGAIHYEDSGWQEIDNEFTPAVAPWDWEMLRAGYYIQVKEDFTAGQVIGFWKNGEVNYFQPMALEWTNDFDQIQQISIPQDVTPIITNPVVDLLPAVGMLSHHGTIKWNDAYGQGIDFEWKAVSTRLLKLLTIGGLNDLPPPEQYILDGGNPVLRLNLIFNPPKKQDVDILIDGQVWNRNSKIQTFNTIEFVKGSEVLWGFMPLMYWDSEDNEGQSVATVEKRGNSLYISIRVPYDWLQSAIYPVFIDADIDEEVEASTDDCHRTLVPSTFSTGTSYLYAGDYQSDIYDYTDGMRFITINIPNGSDIDVAYIELRAIQPYGTIPTTIIEGEDTDDAATFSNAANYDARARTTAKVNWTPGAWNYQIWYQSPEIKTIIQEIIDREGWVALNDLVIIWRDAPGWISQKLLAARSYDAPTDDAPKLHIEFTLVEPDISVSPNSYDFGAVAESSTPASSTTYFTITNASTMITDSTVSVTTNTWSGGVTWTHSDTATAGEDTAGLLSNKGGTWGTNDVIVKYTTPNTLAASQAASTNWSFGLKLIAPTLFGDGVQKSIIVRITTTIS